MREIIKRVEELLCENDRVVVALDGPCASGKTTLAKLLEKSFDCNVIHMDDFFLRPHQRTAQRLAEPGGNLDRERFSKEVIAPLIRGEEFAYRPYVCSCGELGDPIFVPRKKVYIIEGSYSHHPFFGENVYDLRVFLDIVPEEQIKRLAVRDPEKLERFLTEWIPMEKKYFEVFDIREKADLVLNMEKEG